MSQQTETINRDKNYKKEQTEILRLKNTITKMKNSLEGFDSTFEQT